MDNIIVRWYNQNRKIKLDIIVIDIGKYSINNNRCNSISTNIKQ